MAGAALARSPGQIQATPSTSTSPAPPAAPSADQVVAAKKEACDAWSAAARAMVAARKQFVESPPERDNPITASALAQAEAANAVQVAYVRQHIPAATPPDIAAAINEYLAAATDTIAADGQPGADAAANAAAARTTAAATKIKAACGG